jgi:glycosyltransferase 2 family protein
MPAGRYYASDLPRAQMPALSGDSLGLRPHHHASKVAPVLGKHRYTVIAIGLLASALFVYLAVRHLDFASLAAIWSNAELMPWVPIGVAAYLMGHVVRGQRCRLLVRRTANLGIVTASNIVIVGYAANNVLPARLGEFVRAGMLAERTGMPVVQSITITFIERVLDGLAILFLLLLGLALLGATGDPPGWIDDLVRIAIVVFGAATLVMFASAHSPAFNVSVATRVGNKLGPHWHDRLVSLATSITNAGACLRDPKDALLLTLYSVVIWSLDVALFTAIFPVFGLPINIADGMIAMSVTNLGLLVPSSPGFIGPFHFFCSRALMAHGVPEASALAYATLVHLSIFISTTVWGAAAMLWYGVEVGATAAMTREARLSSKTASARGVPFVEIAQLSPPPPEPPASAFTIGLVEAMVTARGQPSDPAAVAYAATFVDGQIRALQPKLGFMFGAGMTMFRFVTRLRYVRGYCDLSLETRRRWTLRWAEGRIALLRQLFKPVRATALLAYYDFETVRRELLEQPDPAARALVPVAGVIARSAPELAEHAVEPT